MKDVRPSLNVAGADRDAGTGKECGQAEKFQTHADGLRMGKNLFWTRISLERRARYRWDFLT